MIQKFLLPLAILTLTGCATSQMSRDIAAEPVNVRVIGLNDFHGNLDPPKQSAEAINAKEERESGCLRGALLILALPSTLCAPTRLTMSWLPQAI